MDNLLLAAPDSGKGSAGHGELTEAQVLLTQMVLDSVTSPNTRRCYSLALNELFAFSAGRSVVFQIIWLTSVLIIWHTSQVWSCLSGLPDDQIQTALNLGKAAVKDLGADSKEGKAIQKVLDFYGDAGKKNGVNVSFETMKPGQVGTASMGKDGSINLKFDLTQINAAGSHSSQPGASMFGERVATVVHEGTHGVDERRWGHNPAPGQQEDWTEHNAYRNESYAVTGLGWFSASGQFYPGMSNKDREAAIDTDAKASDAAAGSNLLFFKLFG